MLDFRILPEVFFFSSEMFKALIEFIVQMVCYGHKRNVLYWMNQYLLDIIWSCTVIPWISFCMHRELEIPRVMKWRHSHSYLFCETDLTTSFKVLAKSKKEWMVFKLLLIKQMYVAFCRSKSSADIPKLEIVCWLTFKQIQDFNLVYAAR